MPREKLTCARCKIPQPAKNFGPDARKVNGKSSWCKPCKKEYQREYARRRKQEPEWVSKKNETARAGRFAWYGLTEADYEEMLALQGGGCAGCGRPPNPDRRLDIDHEHQPADKKREPWERALKVRGLLCHLCNRVLGILRDDPAVFRNLAKYLEEPPAVLVIGPKLKSAQEYLQRYEEKKALALEDYAKRSAKPPSVSA